MKIINNRNDLLNIFEKNLIVAEIGIFKGEFSKGDRVDWIRLSSLYFHHFSRG